MPRAPRLLDTLTQHMPPLPAHNPGNSSDFRLICAVCSRRRWRQLLLQYCLHHRHLDITTEPAR
eukprot:scaffold129869_cov36-Phaeocystis_antarctica.AAC.1